MKLLLLCVFMMLFLNENLEGSNVSESDAAEIFVHYEKVQQLYKNYSRSSTLYRHYNISTKEENDNYPDVIIKTKLNCSNSFDDPNCTVIIKWDNYVPYELDEYLPIKLRTVIMGAIASWNSLFGNCIRFTRRAFEEDYVTFVEAPSCFSAVGKVTGQQIIGLNEQKCSFITAIFHEIVNTIGIRHEHMRPDRDNYIKFFTDGIDPDLFPQCKKYEDFFFKEFQNMPYDYYSITHYPVLGRGFAMEILKDNVDASLVGNYKDLSFCDFVKVKTLYCPRQITGPNVYVRGCNSYTRMYTDV